MTETVNNRKHCAHCGRELPSPRMSYCPGSCKTLNYRLRKKKAEEVLIGVGFTAAEAVNIVEGAGMKQITALFTALGIGWRATVNNWDIVNPDRWQWFETWLKTRAN